MKCLFVPIACILVIVGCTESKKVEKRVKTEVGGFENKIDSLLNTKQPRVFNGVVYITKNDSVAYAKAKGFADFETNTPIALNDNFRIQSNSKQVTATLILLEVEKGTINLEKSIDTYLPNLNTEWVNTVTVHNLLNMTSGITELDSTLKFEPGTDFHYSNPGYGLLGQILANVSGKTYAENVNKLFANLGMNNSFCYEFGKENKVIDGYRISVNDFEKLEFSDINFTKESWNNFAPAGGIISNVKDLNIWDKKLHGGKILKPASYQKMTNYHIKSAHPAFGSKKVGYGYGVRIDENTPLRHIGHAGRGIGFANIKFYIPEKNIDVIVLENVYNENEAIIYHFEKAIRDAVLNSNL
ncbi:serine hydrolase domain-containing protein [Flagellimonas meridianipacifica]|uniref:CubicO group peptidase (Beta-lactamase class C family) n=1 Tax=Flagellimonas meridianipacifica TaxID=1080225 RepID=A0A2T0MAT5_9FLAO|nr:serine hydrolase domain-containing protein [Allomuricauda pacifica]PRX54626.1 CubicO group peptidase (beta-lactamase class C family) [Allomuricauda pacifica]